jgi:hypothetical protein
MPAARREIWMKSGYGVSAPQGWCHPRVLTTLPFPVRERNVHVFQCPSNSQIRSSLSQMHNVRLSHAARKELVPRVVSVDAGPTPYVAPAEAGCGIPKFAATAGLRSFQMKLSYQKCRIPTEYSVMSYACPGTETESFVSK